MDGGDHATNLVTAFTIALVLGPGVPTLADQGTRCTFDFEISFSPGLSMTPTTGTHGGTGPLTCDGVVNGEQPTGSGTLTDDGRYGTKDPDTCSGSETVPTPSRSRPPTGSRR
jgi:hypothetical protein